MAQKCRFFAGPIWNRPSVGITWVRKTLALFHARFIPKNDSVTKTGSGRPSEKVGTKGVFSQGNDEIAGWGPFDFTVS